MSVLNLAIFSSDGRLLPLWQDVFEKQNVDVYTLLKKARSDLQKLDSCFEQTPNLKLVIPQKEVINIFFEKLEIVLELRDLYIKIGAVVTQPAKTHRNMIIVNPVDQWAKNNQLKVLDFDSLRHVDLMILDTEFDLLDIGFIGSYGQIIPKKVLQKFPYGVLNWHPSLLPKYRGASPIQENLLKQDSIGGLSLLESVLKMDAGDIFWQFAYSIQVSDSTNAIMDKMVALARSFWILGILSLYLKYQRKINLGILQDHSKASFSSLIDKNERFVSPELFTAKEIYTRFQAYRDFPGVVVQDEYFKNQIKLTEIQLYSKILDLKEFRIYNNWYESKSNKNKEVLYLCKNQTYLKVLKIRLQTGKEINFQGYHFSND
jgi:methionyl-tRNA formyltransferase